jgi:ring-1,2-phenylacetyl-CoA epoxidase subunit PaaE
VREVPGGLFSGWLVRHVRPGDVIDVGTPGGLFTPGPAPAGQHVMIAAGSGITPLLSIAATLLRDRAASVALFAVNRHADTIMFADDLADLKDRYTGRFQLAHILSREPREPELFTGRLDKAKLRELLGLLPAPETIGHWWLCGPAGLVGTVADLLSQHGVPRAQIHRELFHAGDLPPAPIRRGQAAVTGQVSDVTVILDGRSTTVAIPAETPILDGAQKARPDLPFACKGGICGTCRAKIASGQADMRRNFALEESEVAAGYVLTCQSLPATKSLTVDYDA